MELTLNSLENALILMSAWEITAVFLGIAYVVLAAKESLWAWLFGFFSTLIYTVIFWEGALLSSSLLNFYYMIMAAYGYYMWKKGEKEKSLAIRQLSWSKNFLIIAIGILVSIAFGYISTNYSDAKMAYMDAFVLVFSFVATWMLTQKILENWLYWLLIDMVAIILYWNMGYLATVLLFIIYIILGIYGYFKWKRELHPINLKPYNIVEPENIVKFELLKQQGHCNLNYILETEEKNFLIRKFKYSGNRKAEFYIQNLAHKKGLGAKALLLDEPNKLMICDYVEGEHLFKLDQITLKKLAKTLAKLHSLKIQQQPNNFKNNFKYKNKKAYEALKVIKTFKPEYVLGHNDLHPKNILFGKKIQFIDWEYAGKSDRYFDLAAIIIEFKLHKKDEASFLRSYFSNKSSINRKKLDAFKVVYKTLWTEWFGVLERGQLEKA